MAKNKVSVRQLFDDSPFTPYQVWVCFLGFLMTLIDGFDMAVLGVALPKIAETLNSEPKALGLAIGFGQFGPLIGAGVLGTLADRWGRKQMLILSAIIFGVFTLLTAYATSVEQLALYRFLLGIGLGGAVPNALAFGSEYSPTRNRAMIATLMFTGMPCGAVTSGLVGAYMLPLYGWQSLFVVAGVVPIIIALLMIVVLPESLDWLVQRGADSGRIRKIVSRINPSLAADQDVEFYSTEVKLHGAPVKHLFTEGRAPLTLLLWVIFFMSFYLIWMLIAWAPTFLRQSGASVQQSSLGFAIINVGSVIASIVIGRLMDKFNPLRTLKYIFVVAFFANVLFGWSVGSSFIVFAAVAVFTGLFSNGGNSGLMGLAAISYPLDIRATGIGWAYGVGKLGSLAAPVVGGYLLSLKWSIFYICTLSGITALIVAAGIVALERYTAASSARSKELSQAA